MINKKRVKNAVCCSAVIKRRTCMQVNAYKEGNCNVCYVVSDILLPFKLLVYIVMLLT